MSKMEIRPIQSRIELEEVYELLDHCFPVGKSYFQSRLDHSTAYRFDTTWVAVVDGAIASTVQVFPYICRVEEVTLKVAGIGSVATKPEYRGQGLGLQILQKLTEWMAQEGYDLSLLLASIHPFYEKLGWTIVPETEYWLPADQFSDRISLALADSDAAAANAPYSVKPLEPSAHLEQIAAIFEQNNQRRTLSRVRNHVYWQEMLQSDEWREGTWSVALLGEAIIAYGRLGRRNPWNNEAITLEELCYLPGHESAILPILSHLTAQHPNIETLQFRLPTDHALLPLLKDWNAEQAVSDLMMWKMIRLAETLQIIKPVLERRLRNESTVNFRLALSCEEQSALLIYEEEHLTVVVDYDSSRVATLEFRQPELVTMLLHGYNNEMTVELRSEARHQPHPPMVELLQVMFPIQNSVFYLTDKF
ncbi:hypothetical protein YSY43_36270 [Paenibacillus sp. YSY-4.3]